MRVLIAGASGGVGQQLVQEAVSRGGIEVYALVRTATKLPESLAARCAGVLVGNAKDAADVEAALDKAQPDVVVTAIGGPLSDSTTRAETTCMLLDALLASPHESVRNARVVAVSSVGAGNSMHQIPWILRPVLGFMLRNALKDHSAQEEIVREKMAAGRWMVVRPTGLQDTAATHAYDVSVHGRSLRSSKVARADVAHFIVGQIVGTDTTGESYWGKTVAITG
jgi:NADPH:quinone reductase-like Zn-dependent oxidoreductase